MCASVFKKLAIAKNIKILNRTNSDRMFFKGNLLPNKPCVFSKRPFRDWCMVAWVRLETNLSVTENCPVAQAGLPGGQVANGDALNEDDMAELTGVRGEEPLHGVRLPFMEPS